MSFTSYRRFLSMRDCNLHMMYDLTARKIIHAHPIVEAKELEPESDIIAHKAYENVYVARLEKGEMWGKV